MFKANPWLTRLLLSASFMGALPAVAQVDALRNADDQYIQGLREQGMADLLDRFVETDPPEDPVARLALDVALKEFVSNDLLERASQANQDRDFAQANALFLQSRSTFEEVLAAQRQLIADNPDDERLPLWQTDLAEMLIDRYLGRYFQSVVWHYEFGLPTAEQSQAFESAMVEALEMTMDASHRLGLLPNRLGAQAQLRRQLEEMQIFFKLEDYGRINTSYWLAHAAHGVSLLPDSHAYFQDGDRTRGQRPEPAAEKARLRLRVVDECGGPLAQDSRTELTAKLLSGKTLVWSDDIDDIDDGVEEYLEKVIEDSAATQQGYLATLGKAIGRYNAGDREIAEDILKGMGSHPFVRADAFGVARLLAADLHFRILTREAGDDAAKQAAAYEQAYLTLINDPNNPQFKQQLFTRWAESIGAEVDPASLPGAVRMGIGEQLTTQGAGQAQLAVQLLAQSPAEAQTRITQARELLAKAKRYNDTLVGDSAEPSPLLARGLFNSATGQYWLAEMNKALSGGQSSWEPYYEAARVWLSVVQRVPEAEQAQQAATIALNLLLPIDHALNSQAIQRAEVRATYTQAFEVMDERWPQLEPTQNNRLYAGFQLYERVGELKAAADVYASLPSTHKDYFEARRQMVYSLHRYYRSQSDKLRLMVATQPLDEPPAGLNAQQVAEYEQAKQDWVRERNTLSAVISQERDLIIDEAELVMIDAADEAEHAREPAKRFAALTALGACRVVLAGIEADRDKTDLAMQMLEGFETQYAPTGPHAELAAAQANPENAKATLQSLVQSAQEQRILALLGAERTNEMAEQAKVMMQQSPDVAAAVINGVLQRVRAEIDRENRAIEAAAFEGQRQEARQRITFFANAAVELGELLVDWARGQDFTKQQMAGFEMPLAEAMILAGRGKDAVALMTPIVEMFPNNFRIIMLTGRAHLSVFKQTKEADASQAAMDRFATIVRYYNQQTTKPAPFWEAWLSIFELLDANGDPRKEIPQRARMLYGVDDDLGGPSFKDDFEMIIRRNGGVERLQPQP